MDKKAEDILSDDLADHDIQSSSKNSQQKLAAYILRVLKGRGKGKFSQGEKEQLWNRIDMSVGKSSSSGYAGNLFPKLVAAAAAIVLVTATVWFSVNRTEPVPPIAEAALDNRYLLADTGAVKLVSPNHTAYVAKDGETIDLSAPMEKKETRQPSEAFSTLSVPYGKRTEVILPDGSRVWLNAGSQLTFPEQFESGKREVYLEGEGYFDIAHNPSKPFYVRSANMLIKVLGTAFNVSSYMEDAFASTVLLRGKIELSGVGDRQFERQVLEPGNTAILQKDRQELRIHRENAEDHISWTKRQLILKSTPMNELLVKLERIYNTEIMEQKGILTGETFSGRLDLTQPLAELLTNIFDQHIYDIQQEERRIIIQRR